MKLYDYQRKVKTAALRVLQQYGFIYIAGELRTGKTLVALHVAADYLSYETRILFITKKKAISSIKKDYEMSGIKQRVNIISMDSLHKVDYLPDLVIIDEAHSFGSFPKSNLRARNARKKFIGLPIIFLSGTPSPESYSQLFHQLWITGKGPWVDYKNFYRWARKYVDVKQIYIGLARPINDYSNAKEIVMKEFKKYAVFMTQEQAGFNGQVIEKIHTLKTPKRCISILKILKKDRIDIDAFIIGDTSQKLMSYYHQVCSGTYINDHGERVHLDNFKVRFIKQHFKGKKIAIFYFYIAEGDMLKKAFKNWMDDPEEFNKYDDKTFICQVISGREGISLATADEIIFFNISYSAVSYWQARARSQTRTGGDKRIHWLFSDSGIEKEIYEQVKEKKNYTLKHFEKWIK